MIIEFDSKEHVYTVNGEIAAISVTELLKKHGLSPDYSGISKATLKAAANRGKEIHKDLENILNEKDYVATTPQGETFVKWTKKNLSCGVGEQMLAYNYKGMIVCGTADVMGFMKDNTVMIADHKTTALFHRESVSWQVSLLDYFARKMEGEKVNGKPFYWKGATKFLCFHYDKDGKMDVKELEKVPDSEIERLLECEYTNTIYTRQELVVDPELSILLEDAEQYLIKTKSEFDKAEKRVKDVRAKFCELFEKQKIYSWESPNGLKVTYKNGFEKMIVDTKKLKEEYPTVFTDCQKVSKVKPTVVITEKGEEDE